MSRSSGAAAGGSGRSAAEALSASATMVLPGMVGWRVKVKFAGQSDYFPGITTHFADGKMYVLFDDGEKFTASTEEGDKIKFRSQMTAGKLLQLAHARELPSFQRGAFGERIAKALKSRKVDRKMSLSAALKACHVGLFVPDDADDSESALSNANDLSPHSHTSTLQGEENSDSSASDDGDSENYDSDDDDDEDDETDDDGSEDPDDGDFSSDDSESSDDDSSSTSDDGSSQSSTSDSLTSPSSAVSSSSSGSNEESEHDQLINVKWCNEATKVVRACVVPVTVTYADWIKLAETYSGISAAEAVTKYCDTEGDMVMIASQCELEHALENFLRARKREKRRRRRQRARAKKQKRKRAQRARRLRKRGKHVKGRHRKHASPPVRRSSSTNGPVGKEGSPLGTDDNHPSIARRHSDQPSRSRKHHALAHANGASQGSPTNLAASPVGEQAEAQESKTSPISTNSSRSRGKARVRSAKKSTSPGSKRINQNARGKSATTGSGIPPLQRPVGKAKSASPGRTASKLKNRTGHRRSRPITAPAGEGETHKDTKGHAAISRTQSEEGHHSSRGSRARDARDMQGGAALATLGANIDANSRHGVPPRGPRGSGRGVGIRGGGSGASTPAGPGNAAPTPSGNSFRVFVSSRVTDASVWSGNRVGDANRRSSGAVARTASAAVAPGRIRATHRAAGAGLAAQALPTLQHDDSEAHARAKKAKSGTARMVGLDQDERTPSDGTRKKSVAKVPDMGLDLDSALSLAGNVAGPSAFPPSRSRSQSRTTTPLISPRGDFSDDSTATESVNVQPRRRSASRSRDATHRRRPSLDTLEVDTGRVSTPESSRVKDDHRRRGVSVDTAKSTQGGLGSRKNSLRSLLPSQSGEPHPAVRVPSPRSDQLVALMDHNSANSHLDVGGITNLSRATPGTAPGSHRRHVSQGGVVFGNDVILRAGSARRRRDGGNRSHSRSLSSQSDGAFGNSANDLSAMVQEVRRPAGASRPVSTSAVPESKDDGGYSSSSSAAPVSHSDVRSSRLSRQRIHSSQDTVALHDEVLAIEGKVRASDDESKQDFPGRSRHGTERPTQERVGALRGRSLEAKQGQARERRGKRFNSEAKHNDADTESPATTPLGSAKTSPRDGAASAESPQYHPTPKAHGLGGFSMNEEGDVHARRSSEGSPPGRHQRTTSEMLIPLQDRVTGETLSPGMGLGRNDSGGGRDLASIGSFQRGELLGSGSFGKVYSALDLATGAYVALKQVTISDSSRSQREVEALEHEIALLKTLQHPNIVQYYGTRRARRKLYIILEFCSGGSVASALKQFGIFSEAVIRIYTEQVVQGLVYLHGKGIIHRDIKGSNLLLVRYPQRMEVKLADFGCSVQTVSEGDDVHKTCAGTIQWMAPEVMKEQPYDNRADVWSLAMTVLEMATGKPPWSTAAHAMYKVCVTEDLPEFPPDLSADAVDFLEKLLQRDPLTRPAAADLLGMPFLSAVDPSQRELIRNMTSSRRSIEKSRKRQSAGRRRGSPGNSGEQGNSPGKSANGDVAAGAAAGSVGQPPSQLSALAEESESLASSTQQGDTNNGRTTSVSDFPGEDDSIWGGCPSWDSSGDGDTLDLDNETDSDASPMNCDDDSVFMSASLFMSETGTVAVSPKAGVGGGFAAQSPAAAVTSTPVVTLSCALGQAEGSATADTKEKETTIDGATGDANIATSPAGAVAED